MADIDDRLRFLDRIEAPDQWEEIGVRPPTVSAEPSRGRRWLAASSALAVAALGIALAVRAFSGSTPTGQSLGPSMNGFVALLRSSTPASGVFGGPADLVLVDPETGSQRVIRRGLLGPRDLTWSPDGHQLAFVQSGGEFSPTNIFVMNSDGTNERQLTTADHPSGVGLPEQNVSPAWSPDGSTIAFSRATGSRSGGQVDYQLYLMRNDGKQQRRLTHGTSPALAPSWSPDGGRLVFESRNGDESGIWMINADGTNRHVLIDCPTMGCFGATGAKWSPGGSRILFTWDHDPQTKLMTVRADGSSLTTILDCRGSCGAAVGASWAPDGSRILFTRIAKGGSRRDVYVINADGSHMQRLMPGSLMSCCPAWQPVLTSTQPEPRSSADTAPCPSMYDVTFAHDVRIPIDHVGHYRWTSPGFSGPFRGSFVGQTRFEGVVSAPQGVDTTPESRAGQTFMVVTFDVTEFTAPADLLIFSLCGERRAGG
jgi:Tol biopolymer transport system component